MSQLPENKVWTQSPTLEEFGLDASIYKDYYGKKNELEKIKKEIEKSQIFRILSNIAIFSSIFLVILGLLTSQLYPTSSVIFVFLAVAMIFLADRLQIRYEILCNLFSSGQYNALKEAKEEIEKQIQELTESIKNTVSPFEEAFASYHQGQVNNNLQTFKDSEKLISIRNFALNLFESREQNIKEVIPPEKIYRTARKIDNWEEINKKRKITGLKGEEIAVVMEQEYLEAINRKDLADKVRHVSLEDGDGLGYDVLSFFGDGSEKYIEVKSTTTSFNAPFYLSRNELGFLNEHNEDYFLYRILITSDTPQFKAYSSSEVLEINEIVPTKYLVKAK